MREQRVVKVHTKVTEKEFSQLELIRDTYGFKSIYQVLQTMLRLLLRYANTEQYEKEEYSMGKEIEDMFDEYLDEAKHKNFSTDHPLRNE